MAYLTKTLAFPEENASKALYETSGKDLAEALDYLCLHTDEAGLKKGFRKGSGGIKPGAGGGGGRGGKGTEKAGGGGGGVGGGGGNYVLPSSSGSSSRIEVRLAASKHLASIQIIRLIKCSKFHPI